MQGAGFICVWILDSLATQAVKVNVPQLLRPEINSEEDVTVEMITNENEIILEKVEEEQNAIQSEDSDDDTNNGGFLDLKLRKNTEQKDREFGNVGNVNTMTSSENWR